MKKTEKNQQYVMHETVPAEIAGAGVERRILAYCNEMMCVENSFDAGAIGAMHHHPHTQITYVASGEFSFTVGEKHYTVKQGDTLLKQDGIEHGCVCVKKGVLVDFFTPMREDFVK